MTDTFWTGLFSNMSAIITSIGLVVTAVGGIVTAVLSYRNVRKTEGVTVAIKESTAVNQVTQEIHLQAMMDKEAEISALRREMAESKLKALG